MKEIITAATAAEEVRDGDTIMIGGFMCCGQPLTIVDALLDCGVKDLTVITNDSGWPDRGFGKLVAAKRVKKLIASHVGLNPEVAKQMFAGTLEVELVPQGTLAERIRCGGAGLGGVLTPTGIGTEVEDGKQKISLDGRDYLLETPLRADFAFISGTVTDRAGNTFIAKSEKNFNTVMATASHRTVVETRTVVERGELDPDKVTVPGVFIKSIVEAGK
ncbi:MAG: CoA transferase subunit A [Elusimicrobiaceae bacterium]|nr:CoA transferase subunit A [Elusimicrobiaceae bacterium]